MCESNGKAVASVQTDNAVVRVTRWDFPNQGDNTGWHQHSIDYVVVPLFDGCLAIKTDDGLLSHVELEKGVSYFRPAGVEHDVISDNNEPFAFIEIEVLIGRNDDEKAHPSFLYPM